MSKRLDDLREAAEAKRLADAGYRKALARAVGREPVQRIAEAAGITRSAVYQTIERQR